MFDDGSITVYYDGDCPVCSREVSIYRRLDRAGRIRWQNLAVDLDDSLDVEAAFRLLHVRDSDGAMHIGFAAHLVMWQSLPGFHLLAWTLRCCRPGHEIAERIYLWLTARRPGLVRRQRAEGGSNA